MTDSIIVEFLDDGRMAISKDDLTALHKRIEQIGKELVHEKRRADFAASEQDY